MTSVKIADLGNNGVKIENIGCGSFSSYKQITSVDLEGIKVILINNFTGMSNLTEVLNYDDLEDVYENCFKKSPWYESIKNDELIRLGKLVRYYKTDDNVLDLTSGKLAGVKTFGNEALKDCKNIDTINVGSDSRFGLDCFYTAHEQTGPGEISDDDLPVISTINIKNIYVDGKKLDYKLIMEDPKVYSWFQNNFYRISCSDAVKDMVDAKLKDLFKQMDMTYYGLETKEFNKHTPTEEFYIRLKIHNYISAYDYDHYGDYGGSVGAFLMGGKLTCHTYADLSMLLLQCAGVECRSLHWDPEVGGDRHVWNSTRIGDEWFESDDGWDSQNSSHSNGWFMLSSSGLKNKTGGEYHDFMFAYDNYHSYPNEEQQIGRVVAKRTPGDINIDDKRDQTDVDLLWDYLKNGSLTMDEKQGDINFDGKIDVTDAVILDNLVNSKALDTDNIYFDGMAQTVKVAFVNGNDRENIKYLYTDRDGYITLPDGLFEAPEGKKLRYDKGIVGQKLRITKPYTVIQTMWVDKNAPDFILGDVNEDGNIDIEDAVSIIQHINGITPLSDTGELSADVSKDKNIDIDDTVILISYINGNSTF